MAVVGIAGMPGGEIMAHLRAQLPFSNRYCSVKILVDENMPYARDLFSRLGEVKAVPGRPIPLAELADADALMVRSVTKVNEALLQGTGIKFVGTATAGTDHVDEGYLQQAGIGFSAAPGCNAIAVVEYVFSSLLMLAEREGFALKDRTVGIVGVGNVGGAYRSASKRWGSARCYAIRRAPIVVMTVISARLMSWCVKRMC